MLVARSLFWLGLTAWWHDTWGPNAQPSYQFADKGLQLLRPLEPPELLCHLLHVLCGCKVYVPEAGPSRQQPLLLKAPVACEYKLQPGISDPEDRLSCQSDNLITVCAQGVTASRISAFAGTQKAKGNGWSLTMRKHHCSQL